MRIPTVSPSCAGEQACLKGYVRGQHQMSYPDAAIGELTQPTIAI